MNLILVGQLRTSVCHEAVLPQGNLFHFNVISKCSALYLYDINCSFILSFGICCQTYQKLFVNTEVRIRLCDAIIMLRHMHICHSPRCST